MRDASTTQRNILLPYAFPKSVSVIVKPSNVCGAIFSQDFALDRGRHFQILSHHDRFIKSPATYRPFYKDTEF
jgi:hypothetical protein